MKKVKDKKKTFLLSVNFLNISENMKYAVSADKSGLSDLGNALSAAWAGFSGSRHGEDGERDEPRQLSAYSSATMS